MPPFLSDRVGQAARVIAAVVLLGLCFCGDGLAGPPPVLRVAAFRADVTLPLGHPL